LNNFHCFSYAMGRGRPRKYVRNVNTTGLQHYQHITSLSLNAEPPTSPAKRWEFNTAITENETDLESGLGLHFDSVRIVSHEEHMAGDESDLEIEELSECGDWVDEDLQKTMYELAVKEGDDPSDEDWLSAELMKRKRQNTGQS
jgi:hypothetical protein